MEFILFLLTGCITQVGVNIENKSEFHYVSFGELHPIIGNITIYKIDSNILGCIMFFKW